MPPMSEDPTGPLKLVPIHRLSSGGKWRSEAMRSYRAPLLLWFTRGQGRITLGGVTRGYGPNNAIFIPPQTMHGFETFGQMFGWAIFFESAMAEELPREPRHHRVRENRAQAEVLSLLDHLQREVEGDRPLRDRAIRQIAGLLGVWLQRQGDPRDAAVVDAPSQAVMLRFTNAIEEQLYTGQSAEDFAEALGLSQPDLDRISLSTCGRTAADLLADRLSFEARRLLLETPLPVDKVSEMLGYPTPARFEAAFRDRTGQAPEDYRDANEG